jgi:hypothetical protein
MFAVRRHPEPPFGTRPDAVAAHQAGHPVSAYPLTLGLQGRMDPRAAIAAPAVGMDAADVLEQRPVGLRADAFGPVPPRIVSTGAHLQNRTHHPHVEHFALVLDETEPHLGGPEKMPMAFFRMSRSICAHSSSF